ncbi:hypothetical protein GUITHDRAFT_153634 [Guillardia theta CCMP2712]|uniref:Uncharacterized protein n=1 Tax=Guillardia theta (strain CCMP2712) TaxID=905079 RepID=L1J154_GUITC|nr:hypothetical protein GUITHDRAFT_153634 [Guillardia theta CCMP2712]EKX42258.1 hypothetical protein GUITHDRAFT_153634 [Guillardia theta CCMP2712]|eukprot:XP_005829238.1 hypothetical protein GUITHDRAFT_153634 [Guillardia theta CCMP2712]
MASWNSEGAMLVTVICGYLFMAAPAHVAFDRYMLKPQRLDDLVCVGISAVFLVSLAALTWSTMGILWGMRKQRQHRVRAWAVAGTGTLWATSTSAIAMCMAWSGSSPSPNGSKIAITVSLQLLLLFAAGSFLEVVVLFSSRRSPSKPPAVASLPEWIMAL